MMESVIIKIKSKEDEKIFTSLAKRLRLKSKVVSFRNTEDEDLMAKWIDEGMESEEVPEEEIFEIFRKHGIKV